MITDGPLWQERLTADAPLPAGALHANFPGKKQLRKYGLQVILQNEPSPSPSASLCHRAIPRLATDEASSPSQAKFGTVIHAHAVQERQACA